MEDRRLREEEEEEKRRVTHERGILMTLGEDSNTSSTDTTTGYMDMYMFHEEGQATDIGMKNERAGVLSSPSNAEAATRGTSRTVGCCARDAIVGAWR